MDEKTFIDLYDRQKESGLTVKEFCSNEIIAPATFYYWKKRLKNRNSLPGFIPVVVKPAPGVLQKSFPDNSFSTTAQPANNITSIEIEFSNKTILRINSEIDMPTLKTLIHLND